MIFLELDNLSYTYLLFNSNVAIDCIAVYSVLELYCFGKET